MIFSKNSKTSNAQNLGTTQMQKLLTYGMILFLVYVYFTEKGPKKAEDITEVTNLVAKTPAQFEKKDGKLVISITKEELENLNKAELFKESDKVSLFEVVTKKPEPASNKKVEKVNNAPVTSNETKNEKK